MTVNLSGRPVECNKLKNVVSYEWEDHKTPSIEILFVICQSVAEFLAQNDERVAVFHCNHGKGRTGTIICCLFLYLGLFSTPEEAMKYYAEKRFEEKGYGVTQPCQIQYVHYFAEILNEKNRLFPPVLALKKVQLKGNCSITEP